MTSRRTAGGVAVGLGASLAVAAVAIGTFAWATPRAEAPMGFRAYLETTEAPLSIAVTPPELATAGPITATSALAGFLKGLAGIPNRAIAASVAAEADALGGSESVQILRSMSASVNDDGTTGSLFSVRFVSDTGLHKAAEMSSSGLAFWYSPPVTELPADVTPGSTWSGSGSVNGIADYESVGRIETSGTPDCIVAATTMQLIIEGSDPIVYDVRTTWCKGQGSTTSTDVTSGRVVSVVPAPGPQDLPDAQPAATSAYPDPLALPFLSPSVLLPAQVIGDMLVTVNSATEDIVAVPLTASPSEDAAAGDEPATTLPIGWMQHPGGNILGAVGDGQALFVTTTERSVISFDRAGGLRWSAGTPDVSAGAPVVAGDVVVMATLDGSVIAFDRATGERMWTRTMSDAVVSDPVVAGGYVIIADIAGRVTAFDTDGETAWRAEVGPVTRPISSLPDGSVLVGDDAGSVHRLAVDGALLWSGNLAGSVEGPARVTGGVIVLPTTSGLQGLALDTGVDRWIEEAWADAQAWSHSSGVAVTRGDQIAQVSSDGLVSSQTSLVEPDGEPATEVQVVDFSGRASLLTSRGALLPWPGIE